MMIDEKKLIEEYARQYAENIILYGVDITEKWETAVIQSEALNRAYIHGVADGRKYGQNRRWIPCSERLPEDGETYLITIAESFEQYHEYMGWYDGTKGIWHMAGNYERKMNVIAWMPLPEPYKAGD